MNLQTDRPEVPTLAKNARACPERSRRDGAPSIVVVPRTKGWATHPTSTGRVGRTFLSDAFEFPWAYRVRGVRISRVLCERACVLSAVEGMGHPRVKRSREKSAPRLRRRTPMAITIDRISFIQYHSFILKRAEVSNLCH
jgi:hypothetical protein